MTTVQNISPRSRVAWNAFRARVAELGGEVVETAWLGSVNPHRVRCIAGHECAPRPGDVRRGQGICMICVGHGSHAAEAEFRAQLRELGATLLEPSWLGIHKGHLVRCPAGHECTPRPTSVRRGQGICRVCAGMDPQTSWLAFRARVEELGGEVVEPAWLGNDKPHRVRCVNGHEGRPRPSNVLRWGICRTCAGNDTKVAEAAFRARLSELGATLLEPRWRGSHAKHLVRCARGHERMSRPRDVLQGGGICRVCAGKAWDVFYVVADDINDVVKFGITSGNPRPRLSRHARDGFDCVIRLVEGLPGDVAPRLERVILAALRDAREEPVRGIEYFPSRTLALILDIVDGWTAASASELAQLDINAAA